MSIPPLGFYIASTFLVNYIHSRFKTKASIGNSELSVPGFTGTYISLDFSLKPNFTI